MAYKPIAYSLFGIISAAMELTPRGIERIDTGYVSQLFRNWPADCYGVFITAIGPRLFSRMQVLRGLERLELMWREDAKGDFDPALEQLKISYSNPALRDAQPLITPRVSAWQGYMRLARLLLADGLQFGKPISSLPRNALYIDVGHNGLAMPMMHDWLAMRRDVKPVFLVHDAIPFELPELVSLRSVAIHNRILRTAAERARAIIVPTVSAGRSVSAELARFGAPTISVHPINLPISDIFRLPQIADPDFAYHPYFLVCGAIEARKNPYLLLNVWRELVVKLGEAAPRLIFAGRMGHGGGDVIDQIYRSRILKNHVFFASDLSTSSLARLMKGARALLMPSFAEGFGLPPLEALSLGTPAVVSDIPAHRDAIRDYGVFLNSTDGPGWRTQIEAMVNDSPAYLDLKRHIATLKSKTWSEYMQEVEAILENIN